MCSCHSGSGWHKCHGQRTDHHQVCLPGSHRWWEVLHLNLHQKVTNTLAWISRGGFTWAWPVCSLSALYLRSWGTWKLLAWWWDTRLPAASWQKQVIVGVSAAVDGMRPLNLSYAFPKACLFSFTDLLQERINRWRSFWKKGRKNSFQVFVFTIRIILSIYEGASSIGGIVWRKFWGQ